MAEKRITPDDVARRVLRFVAVDRQAPVLVGPSGAAAPTTTRPVGFRNPMTAIGDLIRGGTDGAAARLAVGTAGQVLTVVSGRPAWAAATGGSGATRDLLTTGDVADPALIFADGDVIWIEG